MKIINSELERVLQNGNLINLDIGAGKVKREGYFSLDHMELDGVDIVADLNKPLELLPENCVQNLYSSHVLEHIQEFLPLMREIHRIVKPGGKIEIVVPHFSNVFGFSDPTHVRFFGLYTMLYFVAKENQLHRRKVPDFYTDVRFHIKSIHIEFYSNGVFDRMVNFCARAFLNRRFSFQEFYERRLSRLLHARQIRYIMQPDK